VIALLAAIILGLIIFQAYWCKEKAFNPRNSTRNEKMRPPRPRRLSRQTIMDFEAGEPAFA